MDLEATQAIELSDYDDETDDEVPEEEKKPVAHLKVLCQKGFPETVFPIYEGDNVIGRQQDLCNLYIPLKALSKQHACIEVRGDSHLVYDKGSRNKSKRGKLYFTPEVRYEVHHEDKLTFADVQCVYLIENNNKRKPETNGDETGSETGSESMLNSQEATKVDDSTVLYDEEVEEKSEASSDILQPTQAFAADGSGPIRKSLLAPVDATLMYAADSEDEDEPPPAKPFTSQKSQKSGKQIFVADTPAPGRPASGTKGVDFVPDSESEPDRPTAQETLMYDEDDDEDEEEDMEMKRKIADLATQAYGGLDSDTDPGEDEETDEEGAKVDYNAATQAFGMDLDLTETGTTTKKGSQTKTSQKAKVKAQEEDVDVVPDSQAATQTFEAAEEDVEKGEENETVLNLGNVSTLACDLQEEAGGNQKKVKNVKMDDAADAPTLALVSEEPTQVFDGADEPTQTMRGEDSAPTQVYQDDDAPTQVYPEDDDDNDEASTQVFESPSKDKPAQKQKTETPPRGGDATQVFDDLEADTPTLIVSSGGFWPGRTGKRESTAACTSPASDEATQVFQAPETPVLFVSQDLRQGKPGGSTGKNKSAEAEETQVFAGDDEPTQIFNTSDIPALKLDETPEGKQKTGKKRTAQVEEEATQVYGEDSGDEADATQVFGTADATVVEAGLDDDKEDDADTGIKAPAASDEPTQVYQDVLTEEAETVTVDDEGFVIPTHPAKKGRKQKAAEEAETQAFENPDDMDAMAFGVVEWDEEEEQEEGGGEAAHTDDQATQAFTDTALQVKQKRVKAQRKQEDQDLAATQAYGLEEPEEVEASKEEEVQPSKGRGRGGKSMVSKEEEVQTSKGRGKKQADEAGATKEEEAQPSKGRGRGRKSVVSIEEEVQTSNRRGRKQAEEAETSKEEEEVQPSKGRGRGRKSMASKEEEKKQPEPEKEEAKPQPKGRTRGRKSVAPDVAKEETVTKETSNKEAEASNENEQDKQPTHTGRTRNKKAAVPEPETVVTVEPSGGDIENERPRRGRAASKKAQAAATAPAATKSTVAAEKTVAATSKTPEAPSARKRGRKSVRIQDEAETQAYQEEVEEEKPPVASNIEATQAYEMEVEEEEEEAKTEDMEVGAEPTQAYEMEVEEEEKKEEEEEAKTEDKVGAVFGQTYSRGRRKAASRTPSPQLPPTEPAPSTAKHPSDEEATQAYGLGDDEETSDLPDLDSEPVPEPAEAATESVRRRSKKGAGAQKETALLKEAPEEAPRHSRRGRQKERPGDEEATQAYALGDDDETPDLPDLDSEPIPEPAEAATASVRGRSRKGAGAQKETVLPTTEAPVEVPRRGQRGRQKVSEETTQKAAPGRATKKKQTTAADEPQQAEPKQPETEAPKGRGRGRRQTAVKEEEPSATVTAAEEKPVEPVQGRGARRGRTLLKEEEPSSSTAASATEVPPSGRKASQKGKGKKDTDVGKENSAEAQVSNQTEDKAPTRRGQHKAEINDVKSEQIETDETKQTKATGRASRRGRQSTAPSVSAPEVRETVETVEAKPPSGRGRRSKVPEETAVVEEAAVAEKPPTQCSKRKSDIGVAEEGAAKRPARGRQALSAVSEDSEASQPEERPSRGGRRGKKVDMSSDRDSSAEGSVSGRRATRGRTPTDTSSERESSVDKSSSGRRSTRGKVAEAGKGTQPGSRPGSQPREAQAEAGEEAKTEASTSKAGPARTKRGRGRPAAEDADTESVTSEDSVPETTGGKTSKQRRGGKKTATSIKEESAMPPPAAPKGRAAKRAGGGDSQESQPETGGSKKPRKADVPSTPPRTAQPTQTSGPATPTLRRRTIERKPRVMFTGVVDEHGQKILKGLGGELVDSIYECTHLVTDQVRRTVKFLCGVARGILIVDIKWLNRCQDARTFIDATPFLVKDPANEKKFGFRLGQSLDKAEEAGMLVGYKVHVTKHVKPEPSQMKDIIKCAGGQYLQSMPKSHEDKMVVISCDEDKATCRPALDAGIPVVKSEFLLTGVLGQEVNIEDNRLFANEGSSRKREASGSSEQPTKKRRR